MCIKKEKNRRNETLDINWKMDWQDVGISCEKLINAAAMLLHASLSLPDKLPKISPPLVHPRRRSKVSDFDILTQLWIYELSSNGIHRQTQSPYCCHQYQSVRLQLNFHHLHSFSEIGLNWSWNSIADGSEGMNICSVVTVACANSFLRL